MTLDKCAAPRCKAPGCEKPIPAERLRRHPSTRTCSDDCRKPYRNATGSRKARALRRDQQRGFHGLRRDHYVRLPCSAWLKRYFDDSIPQGHTAASWLFEILEILMRRQGVRTWALNELVADPQVNDCEVTPGNEEIRSRIPSPLWDVMCARAEAEQATSPSSWILKMVYRAVRQTAYWYPQTDAEWRALEYAALQAAGRANAYFLRVAADHLKPDKPDDHPLCVQGRDPSVPEHLQAARRKMQKQGTPEVSDFELFGQFIINRCTQQPLLAGCTERPFLPPGAPLPKNPQEWSAAAAMVFLEWIWAEWKAADPDQTSLLQDRGRLYQEMLTAEQVSRLTRDKLSAKGKPSYPQPLRAIWRNCLLWVSLDV